MYQSMEDLVAVGQGLNNAIDIFDASCCEGIYCTGERSAVAEANIVCMMKLLVTQLSRDVYAFKSGICTQVMSKMLCILFRNQHGRLKALTIKNDIQRRCSSIHHK